MSNKNIDSLAKISERIKSVRKYSGLKQLQFAEKIGISQSTLSEIENGKYFPSEASLKLLESDFHVTGEWLRMGTGQMLLEQAETSNVKTGPPIRGRVPLISWVQAGEWTEVIDSCNLPAELPRITYSFAMF
jgi:transcriptional regulator with XRE-family HTH domain